MGIPNHSAYQNTDCHGNYGDKQAVSIGLQEVGLKHGCNILPEIIRWQKRHALEYLFRFVRRHCDHHVKRKQGNK